MIQRFSRDMRSGKSWIILAYGIVGLMLLVLAVYLMWTQGNVLFFDVPLQIILITILLPLALAFLLFRFANKLDDFTWRSEDE